MRDKENRLTFLDNLRGIAIIAVILFHYFGYSGFQFDKEYPLKNELYFLTQYGFLGVQLFFIVSGFVITMTLLKCKSYFEFVIRRFSRLWPTMLVCSLITFILVTMLSVYPLKFIDLLPGLVFTEPLILKRVFTNLDFNWLDKSYWTLAVEVKFYFFISIIYFMNKSNFSKNFLIYSFIIFLTYISLQFFKYPLLASYFNVIFFSVFISYFLKGIGFYFLFNKSTKWYELLYIPTGLLFDLILSILSNDYFPITASVIITLLFYATMIYAMTYKMNPSLLSAIGLASYSLYLLHQNIGHSIITYFGNKMDNGILILSLILFIIILLIGASYLIYKYFEHPVNKFIVKSVIKKSSPI